MIADRAALASSTRRPWWRCAVGLRVAALAVFALLGVWQLGTALQTSPFAWHDFTQDYIAAEDVLAGRNPYRAQNERIGAAVQHAAAEGRPGLQLSSTPHDPVLPAAGDAAVPTGVHGLGYRAMVCLGADCAVDGAGARPADGPPLWGR